MTSHFALPLLVDLPPSLSTAVTGGCLKMKKKAVRLWNLKQPKCVTRVWLQDQVGRASTLRWQFSSVAQLCPTLQPHGLQHTRPPCPLPTPGACSNSYPLSRWYHPNSSSSVVPFFSCLQSFPASGSLPMSQFSTSGAQIIGVSASASVLPMNIQDWFTLGLNGWIFLLSKGFSRVFFYTTVQKHQFFGTQSFLWSNSYIHTWLLENYSFG